MITGTINLGPLLANLKKAAALTQRDTRDMIRQEATLFVFNSGKTPGIINITPPFSAGTKGKAGLEAGKAKIVSDLNGIFSPVSIKGQRAITQVFGRPINPISVPTKERWPDVRAIYANRSASRRGKRLRRDERSAYYVDAAKLAALTKELQSHVGWTCACWYAAAVAAGLSPRGVPSWIKRHTGAPGAAAISLSDTAFSIELSSDLKYNSALGMEDKALRVLGYRENALRRRLPHLVAAALKKANLAA